MLTKMKLHYIILLPIFVLSSCSSSSTSPDTDNNDNNSNEQTEEVTTGAMEVQISTSGGDLDSDGYTLVLNGSEEKDTDVEDTVVFEDLDKGSHEVELTGVAGNCAVDGDNPKSVNITADNTATVSFVVECESQGTPALVNKIAYESSGEGGGYSKIYVMAEDGSNNTLLHEIEGSNVLSPDISSDGKSIVFSAGGFDNYIYVMDSEGSNVTQLTTDEDDANDYDPVWSSNTKIAFERGNDIYVMDADGKNQTNITNTPDFFEQDPAWSPDGQKIVYVRGEDDSYEQDEGNLYIMDADGNNPEPLTDTAEDIDGEPDWSPDGTKIAFVRGEEGGAFEVFVIDVENNEEIVQITDISTDRDGTEYLNSDPVWSPDGERIAFSGMREAGTFIHVVNTDGTNEVILDNGTINHGSASWSPVQE